jgi:BMFP domain-containing protein YqiC
MRTQLVATAADVISRAMQQGRTLPAALAVALEAAQLLQSPAIAARLAEVEKANAGLDDLRVMALDKNDTLRDRIRTLEADREASDREYEAATARIAELEARLAEFERPADEDPIRYSLTEQAGAGGTE